MCTTNWWINANARTTHLHGDRISFSCAHFRWQKHNYAFAQQRIENQTHKKQAAKVNRAQDENEKLKYTHTHTVCNMYLQQKRCQLIFLSLTKLLPNTNIYAHSYTRTEREQSAIKFFSLNPNNGKSKWKTWTLQAVLVCLSTSVLCGYHIFYTPISMLLPLLFSCCEFSFSVELSQTQPHISSCSSIQGSI